MSNQFILNKLFAVILPHHDSTYFSTKWVKQCMKSNPSSHWVAPLADCGTVLPLFLLMKSNPSSSTRWTPLGLFVLYLLYSFGFALLTCLPTPLLVIFCQIFCTFFLQLSYFHLQSDISLMKSSKSNSQLHQPIFGWNWVVVDDWSYSMFSSPACHSGVRRSTKTKPKNAAQTFCIERSKLVNERW